MLVLSIIPTFSMLKFFYSMSGCSDWVIFSFYARSNTQLKDTGFFIQHNYLEKARDSSNGRKMYF